MRHLCKLLQFFDRSCCLFFFSQIYSFHGGTIKVCTYKFFFASMTSLHAYYTLVQGRSIRELVLIVSICCGQSLNGMNCWFFDVCYKSCRKVNFIFCNFMSFYKNVIRWGLLFTCISGALNLFVKIGKVWFTFNRVCSEIFSIRVCSEIFSICCWNYPDWSVVWRVVLWLRLMRFGCLRMR